MRDLTRSRSWMKLLNYQKKLIKKNHRRLSAVIGSALSADHWPATYVRWDSRKLCETHGDRLSRITVRKGSLVLSLMRLKLIALDSMNF